MGPWIFVAFIAAANLGMMGVGTWWTEILIRRRLQAWRNAVEACGLNVLTTSKPRSRKMRLEARGGPLEVRIRPARRGARVVAVIPGPPGFSGVRIRREVPHMPPGSVREIEIGDWPFDSTFLIEGPTRLLTLLLTSEARRLLLRVNTESQRLIIAGGELLVEAPDLKLPEILPFLLDLGQRFAQPMDAAQRLAETVQQDPEPGVRLRNLILLTRELPGDPRTAEVLRLACSDADLQVRLRAARELGVEGHAVLADLAEGMQDDSCSATAISALGRELPLERTQAILVHALRLRRMQTARACLEELGRNGTAAAVETLTKVLAREQGGLAQAAAVALGAAGGAAAEPALIQALQRDPAELRVAAANALGRAGSAAAVLPLKAAAARFPSDEALQRAARQAIGEIQSRIQGASPGQLSLTGDEAGQLSLAQAEAGQLSLASDPTGELSLASAKPGQLSLSSAEEGLKPAPERER
jgi:HEAT repeat protein